MEKSSPEKGLFAKNIENKTLIIKRKRLSFETETAEMRQEYSDLRGAYQKCTEEFLLLIVVVSEYYWQATNDHLKGMKNYA